MADITAADVTLVRSWSEGGLALKDRVVKIVSLDLGGQGTTTNAIPASALGWTVIEEASTFVKDDNTLVVAAAPSADGSKLLLKAAATNAPADYTGTFIGTVRGY